MSFTRSAIRRARDARKLSVGSAVPPSLLPLRRAAAHVGALPVPSLTAIIDEGIVTIDGQRGEPVFQPRTCTRCGDSGHNIRRCESLVAAKALLKSRRA